MSDGLEADQSEALFTRRLYTNLCRLELGILSVNRRRVMNRSPSHKLIEERICKVSPPVWDPPRMWPQVFVFECTTPYPVVSKRYWKEQDTEYGMERCRICGCGEKTSRTGKRKGVVPIRCPNCSKFVHLKCCEKIGLSRSSFSCSKVTRPLRPKAVELPFCTEKLPVSETICLICGMASLEQEESIVCSKGCEHWVHFDCCRILFVKYLKYEFTGGARDAFSCSDVTFQMRRFEVEQYVRVMDNPVTPCAVRSVINGVGKRKRYTKETARYKYEYCGKMVDHMELDHEAVFCEGFKSKPMIGGTEAYILVKRA